MAATSSFDVTSTIDFAEVDNALNQARKEVGQRYDFKGAKAEIDLNTADKKQVATMVQTILRLDAPPTPADASDALALALCHLAGARLRAAAGLESPGGRPAPAGPRAGSAAEAP